MDEIKALFKYPGAKWNIARWIVGRFPQHHSYLEPFFGSGAVLFNKERSNIETVNDLNGDIINLFDWIRHDPERLAREVYWTPYARAVYERALTLETKQGSFERAVVQYTKMMMAYGFRSDERRNGWRNDIQGREKAYAAQHWCDGPQLILEAAERLRGVQIECRPAVEVIRRYDFPNVLIYADPPYLPSVRKQSRQYSCEMDEVDHEELLQVLTQHSGPVVLSGYENEMYDEALRGWRKVHTKSCDQSGRTTRDALDEL